MIELTVLSDTGPAMVRWSLGAGERGVHCNPVGHLEGENSCFGDPVWREGRSFFK